jgi:cytochrome c
MQRLLPIHDAGHDGEQQMPRLKDRTAYDPAAYMATIKRKNPEIVPFLPPLQGEA